MLRRVTVVLLVVLAVVGTSAVVGVGATGEMDSAETSTGAETTATTETTPDDGPNGHADDPFPSWLPLLFAAGLLVGVVTVGGGLWFVFVRVRRLLGQQ